MNKLIVHRPTFRLMMPFFFGFFAYLFILLAFGRLGRLGENFELGEFLFCLFTAYGLSEGLLLTLPWVENKWPFEAPFWRRIAVQVLTQFLVCAAWVSACTGIFFVVFLGLSTFSSFSVEFFSILRVFLLGTLLFEVFYFALRFLYTRNEGELQVATAVKSQMDRRMQHIELAINPQLFYGTLEQVLIALRTDPDLADEMIAKLARVYRYTLERQQEPWISVKQELKAWENLVSLYNDWHGGHIQYRCALHGSVEESFLVPGILPAVLQTLVNTSMISLAHPLSIHLAVDDQTLSIAIEHALRLVYDTRPKATWDRLMHLYPDLQAEMFQQGPSRHQSLIRIPLFSAQPMTHSEPQTVS